MIPPDSSSSRLYFAWPIAIGESELSGERVVEEGRSVRPRDHDLGHVRDVEQTGRLAHRVVLGKVGSVAHRHLPSGEIGEARAGVGVELIQRGQSFTGRGIGHEFSWH